MVTFISFAKDPAALLRFRLARSLTEALNDYFLFQSLILFEGYSHRSLLP
jgi:hypothetical protein